MMRRIASLCLLISASLAAQGPAPINSVYAHYTSGSSTTSSAIDTTGSKLNVVWVVGYYFNGASTPPTDSNSNVYTCTAQQREDGDTGLTFCYSLGPTTSTSTTFTVQGADIAFSAEAYSNIASGPDKTSTNQGASPVSSGAFTPTNANELVLSGYADYLAASIAVNSPMTIITSQPNNGGGSNCNATYCGIGSAYQAQGGTATSINATWVANIGVTSSYSFFSTLSPQPLSVTTTAIAEAFNGSVYTAANSLYPICLAATGGVVPYTWSITSGTPPTGLTFGSNGCWSGTPSVTVSARSITYKVTDSLSTTAPATLPITVASTTPSLSLGTCSTSETGTQYASFSGCTLSASGGTSGYSFSTAVVTDESYSPLPEGLSFDSSGDISGTIYGQGGYTPKIVVTDSLGSQASLSTIQFEIAGNNAWASSIFPSNSVIHSRVDSLPIDTSPAAPIPSVYTSATIKPFFGASKSPQAFNVPNGIGMIEVPYSQPYVSITGTPSPPWYFTSAPIPPYCPVESSSNSSGDRHCLVYQEAGAGNPALWEMWESVYSGSSSWADQGQGLWPNTTANTMIEQGNGSADAAGLFVLPYTVNADEVIGTGTPSSPNGTVQHAIRFTLNHTLNYHVWPATAQAGNRAGSCTGGYEDANYQLMRANPPASCGFSGPMGEIYRLKSSVSNPSCASTSPQSAIIITAFRDYGIILADNGDTGGIIGTPDSRWNDSDLSCLGNLTLSDFEPVDTDVLIPSANLPAGCPGTNGDCATLDSYQANQPTAGTQLSGVASSVIQ